jgi:uncharacterized iron-regulated protein
MRRALACLLFPAAAAAAPEMPATAALDHPLAGAVVATADGAALTPEALAGRLSAADVAILGETHDNPEHHAAQAWLVAQTRPAALAFEMIPPRLEGALERLRAEGADDAALGAALAWEARGWPDFGMYAPILRAAPDAPATGGAVEREALTAAMRDGAGAAGRAALGAAAALFALDRPLPPEQATAATAEQVAAHCGALPAEMAATMVEAQRLRDAAFAAAALRARALGGDGRVAIIAGSGHARRDRGVPAALATAAPELTVAALALVEVGDADDWRAYAEGYDVDYLWFTAAAEREDPCAAFRERRQP